MAQQNYVIASSSVKKELENALDQCLAGLKKTYAKHSARHPTNKDYEVAKRKKELEDKQRDDQLTALINQNTLQMLYQNNINQMRISDRMFRNNVYGRNYNPYSRYDGK
jgi:type II secretory pathway component PulJ